MSFLNVEIKARCQDPLPIRTYLIEHGIFKGVDEQSDTYFNVEHGRLKLREGNIENNLIWYERHDEAGPKDSVFKLHPVVDTDTLKSILIASNGVRKIVKKRREIYFIGNVKFHLDVVPGLGTFVEIEASNLNDHTLVRGQLEAQCKYYLKELNINNNDLVAGSYSDMHNDFT